MTGGSIFFWFLGTPYTHGLISCVGVEVPRHDMQCKVLVGSLPYYHSLAHCDGGCANICSIHLGINLFDMLHISTRALFYIFD